MSDQNLYLNSELSFSKPGWTSQRGLIKNLNASSPRTSLSFEFQRNYNAMVKPREDLGNILTGPLHLFLVGRMTLTAFQRRVRIELLTPTDMHSTIL